MENEKERLARESHNLQFPSAVGVRPSICQNPTERRIQRKVETDRVVCDLVRTPLGSRCGGNVGPCITPVSSPSPPKLVINENSSGRSGDLDLDRDVERLKEKRRQPKH